MTLRNAKNGTQTCPFNADLLKVPADGGRIPTEHEEQRAFVELWRKAGFPLIYAIPNGEARGIRAAARLKLEGVKRGMPDLHCPEWNLWIEFKRRKGGSVSEEQKAIHEYIRGIGQVVIVPRGAHEAVSMVQQFIADKKSPRQAGQRTRAAPPSNRALCETVICGESVIANRYI
jgi:hypothetical protein